ncbi:MAG: HAD family hydrolase [Planctomycetota bacterium]
MRNARGADEATHLRGVVIFDCDGTLFPSDTVTVPAVERAFRERGLPVPRREEITRFIGRPSEQFHGWLDGLVPAGTGGEVGEAIDRIELGLVAEVGALYPGVREALDEIHGMVEQMALCTNGRGDYVRTVAAAFGFGRYFDAVRHWERPSDTKEGMVRELLERLTSRPAVLVGDRPADVEAAHHNGVPAIGALYGMSAAEDLAAAEALAESPADLPRLVREALREGP